VIAPGKGFAVPDHILVTFGAVQQASADASSTSASLNSQLADLKAYLAPLVASWQGQAATDYQAQQARWDSAQQGLNDVLGQISRAVGNAHDTYSQTEATNAGMWG
jgi:6 kDa early secretory antigenic target